LSDRDDLHALSGSRAVTDPPSWLSPGLRADASAAGTKKNGRGAYEMKFIAPPGVARALEDALRPMLAIDPHGVSELGGSYRVTSIYADTPDLAVYFRQGEHRACKCRVRRYGESDEVFLEEKIRKGMRVSKSRSAASLKSLPNMTGDSSWWSIIQARELEPTCVISYLRRAFAGTLDECPVRLTFDTALRCGRAGGWQMPVGELPMAVEPGKAPGMVVCEFKYFVTLPVVVKRVIASLGLATVGFSKYRSALPLLGLVSQPHDQPHGARGAGRHA